VRDKTAARKDELERRHAADAEELKTKSAEQKVFILLLLLLLLYIC
jgi:hypothetical protein